MADQTLRNHLTQAGYKIANYEEPEIPDIVAKALKPLYDLDDVTADARKKMDHLREKVKGRKLSRDTDDFMILFTSTDTIEKIISAVEEHYANIGYQPIMEPIEMGSTYIRGFRKGIYREAQVTISQYPEKSIRVTEDLTYMPYDLGDRSN